MIFDRFNKFSTKSPSSHFNSTLYVVRGKRYFLVMTKFMVVIHAGRGSPPCSGKKRGCFS